jgi:uncharacterized protein YbjQ (UPF0145 family)
MSELVTDAIAALRNAPSGGSRGITSDLSVDESLLLHGAGYEPVDLVVGVSVQSIPYGTFMVPYGQTEPLTVPDASRAVSEAFRRASDDLRTECGRAGALGVVGVDVELEFGTTMARVILTGTAIRRPGTNPVGRPFVTDLSVRDLVLLERAGWAPLTLAYGAGFVAAPIQKLGQTLAQAGQNVERVQLTAALQGAREQAMEQMQHLALDAGSSGVVDVKILDGPLRSSRHVLAFICYGTTVVLEAESHRSLTPKLVLSLDDHSGVEATALRGR